MASSPTRQPNILLVFPKFNPNSFWSMQAACDVWGAKCPAPPLGLMTVAALLPQSWNMRLINRNSETLTTRDLMWADLVLTGGMLPQRVDTLDLIALCHQHKKTVVVGGPDVTSSADVYAQADFRVLGEAEGILDQFVAAWTGGAKSGFFEAEKFKADVTTSPTPRFDLIKAEQYLFIGVQFSRGCPFNCEFCDIIELYGKVPRSKTNDQMFIELETLYRMGYRGHVDFVDDNLIGNKKALKKFLPELKAWQLERGFPFEFSTEASINLSDDPALLLMMRDANFFTVFVGIESPDTSTLISMRKKQNANRSLEESIHKIYAAGIFVVCGFIVGFDQERDGVAEAMIDCIEDASLPLPLVGLLTALPQTQLTRRLEKEGRLLDGYWGGEDGQFNKDDGDQCTAGLNFVTLRPRRDVLSDYKTVLDRIYRPDAFFKRVTAVGLALRFGPSPEAVTDSTSPAAPSSALGLVFQIVSKLRGRELTAFIRLVWWMTVRHPEFCRHFWATFVECARHNPAALRSVVKIMVLYLHVGPFSKYVVKKIGAKIDAIDVAVLPTGPEREPLKIAS